MSVRAKPSMHTLLLCSQLTIAILYQAMSNNLKLCNKLLSNEQRHKRSARVTEESEGLVGNRDEIQFLKKDQSRKT